MTHCVCQPGARQPPAGPCVGQGGQGSWSSGAGGSGEGGCGGREVAGLLRNSAPSVLMATCSHTARLEGAGGWHVWVARGGEDW